MIDDFLPPSPNWYCSQASDVSKSGLFAYAARNVIFLLDVSSNLASFAGCLTGHTNRVTAVKFGTGTHDKHLCASAGDDGSVKVWDVRTKSILNEHQFHSENKVTAVDWSCSGGQHGVVLSGDEKGALIWWNHVNGETKEFIPEKQQIYCMSACPHDGAVVAVGYKTGLVLIVCISGKGEIVHRLRGHDEEIHSVCWSPVLGENIHLEKSKDDGTATSNESIFSTEPLSDTRTTACLSTLSEQGCLLISGSRDRTIRVWTATQGKAVLTLMLPSRGGAHRNRERGDEAGVKARVWLAVCWPSDKPREFISSSYGGDLIHWDLSKPGKRKGEFFDLENSSSHSRVVFGISSMLSSPDVFITTSMDRQIICWDMKTQKTVWTLPTLGGFVYSLSACPVNPGCLALGVGDNMIRLWNTSTPGRGGTAVSALWQGIKSKVTALSWHPERDNCLAYGTDDGRVGIYNTFNQGKGPHLSSTFHKKTVYSLDWGPKCPEGGKEYCLYSCGGDGIIYQHDPARLGEDATNFNSLIRSANQITHMLPMRTDICWRADRRAVAIGNENGSIDIVAASTLELLCTIQVHRKLVNCLEWYPGSSQSETGLQTSNQSAHALEDGVVDSGQSRNRFWLASGSNEPQVQVHDLAHILGGDQLVQIKTPITGAFRTLDGHTLRVTALSWNPHGNGQLVSASYDGTAQVWDVVKGEPIANFRGHLGRLFSVAWSILDPDVIYSGGEDFCVLKWKVSKVQHTKPPAHKRNTFTAMQRSGKAKTSSSAKPNKKKKHTSKDTPSMNSTPLKPVTSETLTSNKCVSPKPSSENQDPAVDGTNHDASSDVTALQKILEEKKLEMLKVVAVQEKSSVVNTGEKANDDISAVDMKDAPNEGKIDESVDIGGGVAETSTGITSEVRATEVPGFAHKKDFRRKKKIKSLFSLSRSQDNRGKLYHLEDCIALAQHKYSHADSVPTSKHHAAAGEGVLPRGRKKVETPTKLHPGVGDNIHLGIFADRRAVYAMFREEASHHDEAGNRDQSQQLDMWKGSLAGALTKATETNQLNSFLVSMAPLGGYDVWLETVEAYAKQLERNEEYTQAATYYLACHKIHKAVTVLLDNKLFREAVALASVRLSPFDNVYTDVYKAWARHLESESNYGQAAKCYLAINQPADAVMLLARKSDIPSLSAALRVSYITDQGDLTNNVMVRYLHECLMAGDWLEAQAVLANHKRVLCGSLVACVHEVVVAMLSHKELISRDLFTEPRMNVWVRRIFENGSQMTHRPLDGLTNCMTPLLDQVPLFVHAVDKWFAQCELDPLGEGVVQGLYHEVCSIRQQTMQHLPTKQLLIELAFELALGQLSVMMGVASKAVAHWLQAAVMCRDHSNMDIARGIFCLILPEGELSITKLQMDVHTSATSTADIACLRANYLFTVLHRLWCEVNVEQSNSTDVCVELKIKDDCLSTNFELPKVESSEANYASSSASVNEGTQELYKKVLVCHTQFTFPLQEIPVCSGDIGLLQENAPSSSHDNVNRTCPEETLCTKMSKISQELLSEPRARLKNLQGQLKCVQSAIRDLYAKGKRVSDIYVYNQGTSIDTEGRKSSAQESVDYQKSDDQENLSVTQDSAESQTSVSVATLAPNLAVSDNAKQDTTSEKLEENDAGCPSSAAVERNSNQAPATEQQPCVGLDNVTNGPPVTLEEKAHSLPSNWDELMADVKYTHPAVTYDLLLKDQRKLLKGIEELREFEPPRPFPDTLEVAKMLLQICRAASSKMDVTQTDRDKLIELEAKAVSWGHKHSWLTWQQVDSD